MTGPFALNLVGRARTSKRCPRSTTFPPTVSASRSWFEKRSSSTYSSTTANCDRKGATRTDAAAPVLPEHCSKLLEICPSLVRPPQRSEARQRTRLLRPQSWSESIARCALHREDARVLHAGL